MKRSYYLLMLALVCLLTAAPSYAQRQVKVTFTVSFPFTAGATVMPAGAYAITEDNNGQAMIIPAAGGRGAVILLTHISGFGPARGRASVSFAERGGRYYLDTVNLIDGAVVSVAKLTR
jgi:hypothetical protein